MKNNIEINRIYGLPDKNKRIRILVDKLWPRGISKKKLKIDIWVKDIAPSDKLRKWFNHDPDKWEDFKTLYFKELDEKKKLLSKFLIE